MAAAFQIFVDSTSGTGPFQCQPEENVLNAMKRAGLAVVPSGCQGGGCGICKVDILDGDCRYGKMSRAHISKEQEDAGTSALACKLYPLSDLSIRPSGKLFKKLNAETEN